MKRAFQEYIDTLPWSRDRLDNSTYLAFISASGLNVTGNTALKVVRNKILEGGGHYQPVKLEALLIQAYGFSPYQSTTAGNLSKITKPSFSKRKVRDAVQAIGPISPSQLISWSPVNVQETPASGFLDALYRQGEKILIFSSFASQGQYVYEVGKGKHTQLPQGAPDGIWFLPNPIDGRYRPNPRRTGKLYRRSTESIAAWPYLVLQSDALDSDDWLAVLVQLPLAIVAIYTSGDNSIQALVNLDAPHKLDWEGQRSFLKKIVVPYGADPSAMKPTQLAPLPGCKQGSGSQRLLYLNPRAKRAPIFQP